MTLINYPGGCREIGRDPSVGPPAPAIDRADYPAGFIDFTCDRDLFRRDESAAESVALIQMALKRALDQLHCKKASADEAIARALRDPGELRRCFAARNTGGFGLKSSAIGSEPN